MKYLALLRYLPVFLRWAKVVAVMGPSAAKLLKEEAEIYRHVVAAGRYVDEAEEKRVIEEIRESSVAKEEAWHVYVAMTRSVE